MVVPCRTRRITRADLPAIADIERAVFPDPWSASAFAEHLADPCFLAEGEGRALLGYVVTRITADEAEILNVAVRDGVRRRGVGRALVEVALGALADRGVGAVHLEVRASNEPAISLYESLGFRRVGRRRGYYRTPPEDAVLLSRNSGVARKGP